MKNFKDMWEDAAANSVAGGGVSLPSDAMGKNAQKKKKKANENVAPNHNQKAAPYGSGYKKMEEGDTYEKMAAKGKKSGNLKQGTVRKRLNIPNITFIIGTLQPLLHEL